MSFLFGKSKKAQQPQAIPAVYRDISSSHGAESRIPTANGINAARGPVPNQTPGASVNNSMNSSINSLNNDGRVARERAESDVTVRLSVFPNRPRIDRWAVASMLLLPLPPRV